MIGYLEGSVIASEEKSLCVKIQGVGYEIYTPENTLRKFTEGDSVSFFIYTHVREDQITLFGFETREEKYIFLKLLDVSGIGPRGALGILSLHSPSSLAHIVQTQDAFLLSQTPGIGKKTAEKILIELRGKLDNYIGDNSNNTLTEVRLALETLGYTHKDIQGVVTSLRLDNKTSQELIRESLSLLQK